LWIGAPTEEHYTAFGLWGLAVARRSGWEVDKAALDNGAHWLHNSLRGQRTRTAIIIWVWLARRPLPFTYWPSWQATRSGQEPMRPC